MALSDGTLTTGESSSRDEDRRFKTLVSALQKLACIVLGEYGKNGATIQDLSRDLRERGYLSSRSPQLERKDLDAFAKALTTLSRDGKIRAEFVRSVGQVLTVFKIVR